MSDYWDSEEDTKNKQPVKRVSAPKEKAKPKSKPSVPHNDDDWEKMDEDVPLKVAPQIQGIPSPKKNEAQKSNTDFQRKVEAADARVAADLFGVSPQKDEKPEEFKAQVLLPPSDDVEKSPFKSLSFFKLKDCKDHAETIVVKLREDKAKSLNVTAFISTILKGSDDLLSVQDLQTLEKNIAASIKSRKVKVQTKDISKRVKGTAKVNMSGKWAEEMDIMYGEDEEDDEEFFKDFMDDDEEEGFTADAAEETELNGEPELLKKEQELLKKEELLKKDDFPSLSAQPDKKPSKTTAVKSVWNRS